MRQFSLYSRVGLRNRAFVTVLYRAGLRCNEARHLGSKDIDADYGTVRVLFGKRQRARTAVTDPVAQQLVAAWARRRETFGYPRDAPLFCTSNGRLMADSYIRTFVKKAARDAGIARRVHPHGFRHAHAFELAMEGMPIHIIQRQLGHVFAATTLGYINHIAPAEMLERIRGRSWDLPAELAPRDDLALRWFLLVSQHRSGPPTHKLTGVAHSVGGKVPHVHHLIEPTRRIRALLVAPSRPCPVTRSSAPHRHQAHESPGHEAV